MPKSFTLIAYRGGASEAPENTCEALLRLARLRLPAELRLAVEVDIRTTRDGELVAMHDERIDRTTTGRGKVAELTLAELRRVDAAPGSGLTGVRVPTLEEVLDVAPDIPLVLDLHGSEAALPAALVASLRRHRRGGLERIVVASELTRVVHAVRRFLPALRTAATPREVRAKVLLERARLDRFAARGRVWMIPECHGRLRVLTRRFAHTACASGDAVWAWLAEDHAAAMRFKTLGATGVFTPCPAAIAALWG